MLDPHRALHRIADTACDVRNTLAIHSNDFNDEGERTMVNRDFQTFCQLANVTSKAQVITSSELCAPIRLGRPRFNCADERGCYLACTTWISDWRIASPYQSLSDVSTSC